MFVRAAFAFVAMPGIVAYVVPVLLAPESGNDALLRWIGAVFLGVGTILLLWCVRDFYVAGRGTLAPWSPPDRLVTVGLYRWSRNPMYLSVLTVLIGWAVWYGSLSLAIYAAAIAAAFHLRILLHEEPWLSKNFGEDWRHYEQNVPRWLIR